MSLMNTNAKILKKKKNQANQIQYIKGSDTMIRWALCRGCKDLQINPYLQID